MYITIKEKKIIGEYKDWTYKYVEQTRTLSQNRLYWWFISDLTKCFDDMGVFITSEDLHEWLSQKLLKGSYNKNSITGMRTIKRKSTTKLSKKEFSKYIEDIEKYLIQTYNISCPLRTDNLLYNN